MDLPIEHGDFPELWDSLPGGTVSGWWFGTFVFFLHILGISSSQLTNSYFSEGWVYHQPDIIPYDSHIDVDISHIIPYYFHIPQIL